MSTSCVQRRTEPRNTQGLQLHVPESALVDVQTLYLSSNELTSLAGVEQFAQLESLSVVGNRLHSFSNLLSLQQCTRLRHLRAEENPVCRLPFYRCA